MAGHLEDGSQGRVRLPDRDNPTSSSALYVAASDGSNPRRLTPSTLPWLVPEPAPISLAWQPHPRSTR